MERKELLQQLAPCGLDCGRCVRYNDGTVAKAARELTASLEGYGKVAPRYAAMSPVLNNYPQFEAVLDLLASADCPGCRNDPTKCFPVCAAKNCHREKKLTSARNVMNSLVITTNTRKCLNSSG